jgi:hypothetical protein
MANPCFGCLKARVLFVNQLLFIVNFLIETTAIVEWTSCGTLPRGQKLWRAKPQVCHCVTRMLEGAWELGPETPTPTIVLLPRNSLTFVMEQTLFQPLDYTCESKAFGRQRQQRPSNARILRTQFYIRIVAHEDVWDLGSPDRSRE